MLAAFSVLSSGITIFKVGAFVVSLLVGTGFMKSCTGSGISARYAKAEVKNMQGILADNIAHQTALLEDFETHNNEMTQACKDQVFQTRDSIERACALTVLECQTLNEELLAQVEGTGAATESRCLPTSEIPPEIRDILELGQ